MYTGVASSIMLCAAARHWARTIERINKAMQTFDVMSAKCFSEDDRIFVESNITNFMLAKGLAENEEDALHTFNILGRKVDWLSDSVLVMIVAGFG